MGNKAFWQSKTFWVNLISAGALIAQSSTDAPIPPETQGAILAVVNIILRFITKEPITWKKG